MSNDLLIKDATDWFEAGGTPKRLKELTQQAPSWTPESGSFLFSTPYREEREKNSVSFKSVPLGEFMASGDAKITWIAKGLIPKDAVAILGGSQGIGKSWMLLDLAIECARGGLWLGRFQTLKGPVLYIDEESAEVLLRKRFKKLLIPKGLSADGMDVHLAVQQDFSLSNPESVRKLKLDLDRLHPVLVIIDSLIRVHKGQENSATEMADVFKTVKRIVSRHHCSIVFADHQRKLSHLNAGFGADQQLRGSTDKAAFVDSLLSLSKSSRKKGLMFVEQSKSRFAEAVPAFALQLRDDPEKISTTLKYVGSAALLKTSERLRESHEYISKNLPKEWQPRQALVEKAKQDGQSTKLLDEALKDWIEKGKVQREYRQPEGRGGKQAYYRQSTKEGKAS